ncbi:MAG: Na+/H+ antiporter NhaA [Proteobacteria bacterium]|nr:Na+/H+ antiporter NhaA [Pseudomonadota bacterium]MBU1140839.1 Na+/H+ antiporter NhaA [Pseudomonadota bacterium]
MKHEKSQSCAEKLFSSSLEKTFRQAMTPFEEFVHAEASSGLLLMACTVAALVIANTGLYSTYDAILQTKITIGGGDFVISHSLHHWINDGLMALFFFTVGLEIKREILVGELADRRQAILPIAAALGGMIIPALLYVIINGNSDTINGWGVPMATDIAFAMGVLALLGKRVPRALIGFLLALAIVDDLGAVLVIAAFYTEQINTTALIFAGGALIMLILSNIAGIRHPLPYIVFGILLWLGMLKSGVHATLAGVITALTVPANSYCEALPFVQRMRKLTTQFEDLHEHQKHIMENGRQQKILQSMENFVHKMESPLQRMEHNLHIWVSFLVIPIFALANAGIPIDLSTLGVTMLHPVTLGIILGLIGGKLIGISLFSWLVIKMGWSRLPQGVTMAQIASVALLAGIGFTMSIFIAGLAFDNAQYLLNAKIGILAASLVAGIVGYIALLLSTDKA